MSLPAKLVPIPFGFKPFPDTLCAACFPRKFSSPALRLSMEEGEPQPQVWARTQGGGRVFVCIPGHFTWTFDDPLYRVLLLRGLCWAAHQPVDRFAELVTVGARLGE